MTPEDPAEEQVRRLLAAARPDAMPDHVAARLDATLADLVAQRDTQRAADAPPAPRRRWAPRLLAAAAAVAVLGGTGLLWQLNQQQTTGTSAADSAESAGSADAQAKQAPAPQKGAPETLSQWQDTSGMAVVPLTRESFAATARDAARTDRLAARAQAAEKYAAPCTPPADLRVDDHVQPATYDTVPASLVLREPGPKGQLVQAWSCDGTKVLDSTVVPR